MTHRRLMEDTDAWERAHWKALQNIDGPIGETRKDMRAAMISAYASQSDVSPMKLVPVWDTALRDKANDVQAETDRLNRAMRQLTGGS
jgi:hypothetical protein